jgi:hypothetical protein
MPDFTIVDDGGDSGPEDKELSQQFFEDFVIALLRSLASVDDPYRVVEQFFRFLKHAVIAGTAWASSDSECEFDPIWEDEKSVSCPVRSHWRGSLPSALVSGPPRRRLGVKTGAPNMYDDQSASRG